MPQQSNIRMTILICSSNTNETWVGNRIFLMSWPLSVAVPVCVASAKVPDVDDDWTEDSVVPANKVDILPAPMRSYLVLSSARRGNLRIGSGSPVNELSFATTCPVKSTASHGMHRPASSWKTSPGRSSAVDRSCCHLPSRNSVAPSVNSAMDLIRFSDRKRTTTLTIAETRITHVSAIPTCPIRRKRRGKSQLSS